MLELGASFKKARESRSLSIDSIAQKTRISSRFLLAIENEQFEVLPGGLFNRGFIRTYAEFLGLDPQESILAYENLSHTVDMEPVRHETERVKGKTTKIPVYYVAIAGLLILFVVFYLATRTVNSPAPLPPTAKIAEVEPSPTTTAAVPAAIPEPAPLPTQTNTVPAEPVVLELEVREETWMKVSTDGTAVVPGELLPVGTKRRYTANNSMNISIGNAAGVALRVNGKPVSSLGHSGQVRSLTITPQTSAESLGAR